MARTDLNRIKTLQQNNRKNIDYLEGKVTELEKELEQKLQLLDAKLNGGSDLSVAVRDPHV